MLCPTLFLGTITLLDRCQWYGSKTDIPISLFYSYSDMDIYRFVLLKNLLYILYQCIQCSLSSHWDHCSWGLDSVILKKTFNAIPWLLFWKKYALYVVFLFRLMKLKFHGLLGWHISGGNNLLNLHESCCIVIENNICIHWMLNEHIIDILILISGSY